MSRDGPAPGGLGRVPGKATGPSRPALPHLGQALSAHPGRILVVDDDRSTRRAVSRALMSFGHQVREAGSGAEALATLDGAVDLMVLDLDMPGLDGLQAARHVRVAAGSEVPIIMVTGRSGADTRLEAVLSGVNDFIEKPFMVRDLQLRVEAQLRLRRSLAERTEGTPEGRWGTTERDLRGVLAQLDEARRQTHDAHLAALRSLVIAAEFKDRDTAAHLTRMSRYSAIIAARFGLDAEECSRIFHASPMHDVGKIGIPDTILCKPGPLDAGERALMERHTIIGARILGDSDVPLLRTAREIALGHHERWDGGGYPAGRRGGEIPLSARICAVADFFDALTSDRPYRRAMTNGEVLAVMQDERGRHFDPDVLGAFFDALDEVEKAQRAAANAVPSAREEESDELTQGGGS